MGLSYRCVVSAEYGETEEDTRRRCESAASHVDVLMLVKDSLYTYHPHGTLWMSSARRRDDNHPRISKVAGRMFEPRMDLM